MLMCQTVGEKISLIKLGEFLEMLQILTSREEDYTKFRLGMDREFTEAELETDIKTLAQQRVICVRTREEAREKFEFKTETCAKQLEAKILRCLFGHFNRPSRSKILKDYLDE